MVSTHQEQVLAVPWWSSDTTPARVRCGIPGTVDDEVGIMITIWPQRLTGIQHVPWAGVQSHDHHGTAKTFP